MRLRYVFFASIIMLLSGGANPGAGELDEREQKRQEIAENMASWMNDWVRDTASPTEPEDAQSRRTSQTAGRSVYGRPSDSDDESDFELHPLALEALSAEPPPQSEGRLRLLIFLEDVRQSAQLAACRAIVSARRLELPLDIQVYLVTSPDRARRGLGRFEEGGCLEGAPIRPDLLGRQAQKYDLPGLPGAAMNIGQQSRSAHLSDVPRILEVVKSRLARD